jgi:hypothetical protein
MVAKAVGRYVRVGLDADGTVIQDATARFLTTRGPSALDFLPRAFVGLARCALFECVCRSELIREALHIP